MGALLGTPIRGRHEVFEACPDVLPPAVKRVRRPQPPLGELPTAPTAQAYPAPPVPAPVTDPIGRLSTNLAKHEEFQPDACKSLSKKPMDDKWCKASCGMIVRECSPAPPPLFALFGGPVFLNAAMPTTISESCWLEA